MFIIRFTLRVIAFAFMSITFGTFTMMLVPIWMLAALIGMDHHISHAWDNMVEWIEDKLI